MKIIFLVLLITSTRLFAVETKFISEQGFQNIWLWQLSNTSILQDKGLSLSQNNQNVYSTTSLLWTGTKIRDHYYLGTIESASLLKVDASTYQTKEIYNTSNQSIVGAIVTDGEGVLAAFSPMSELVHFDANDTITARISLSNSYIWDIVANPSGGYYILTGDKAEVYEYYQNTFTNSIAIDQEEHILQGQMINDTLWVLGEHALYKKQDQQFIAVATFKGTASRFDYTNNTFYIIHSLTNKTDNKNEITSYLTAIKENGLTEELYSLKGFYLTSIALLNDNIYMGSDHNGLYVIYNLNDRSYRYTSLGQGKILDIFPSNDQLNFITSDKSGIWILEDRLAPQGEFISEIYDAGNIAIWGKFAPQFNTPENTKITFYVQSGATSDPSYWEPWTEVQAEQQITAPLARYMRFKAVLKSLNGTTSPDAYGIQIPYTQFNLAPTIDSLTIKQEKQKISISWSASDPNKDKLEYFVYLANENQDSVQINQTGITNTNYSFISENFPSGNKIITIVASDLPSNTSQTALMTRKQSTPIMFDNSSPIISIINLSKTSDSATLEFSISDSFSIVTKANIIINGIEKISLIPIDKIFDSKEERFLVNIPLDEVVNFIQIRGTDDALNNTSLGTTIIK